MPWSRRRTTAAPRLSKRGGTLTPRSGSEDADEERPAFLRHHPSDDEEPAGWGARLLRWCGLALMLCALALPLLRAPERSVESLIPQWALPPSDFLDVNGQLVHVRDEGPRDDPRPLVLLHGWASSLHTWDAWAASLRGRHRVVRLDLPGAGLTGPFSGAYAPNGHADYSPAMQARFVQDVIDALHLDHVVLVGQGAGGEVAWLLARQTPQRVQGLVLVDALGYPGTPVALPWGLRLAQTPGLRWLGQWLLPRVWVADTLKSLYASPSRVEARTIDRMYDLLLRQGNRPALIDILAQQQAIAASEARVPVLNTPTLLLWGQHDRMSPPGVATAWARQLPRSRLIVLPDAGHLPQEETPGSSLQALESFLAR